MKKTYTIDGMHCKACELLVKKSLSHDIKNCSVDSANHKTGIVSVTWDDVEDYDALVSVIEDCGYQIHVDNTDGSISRSGAWVEGAVLVVCALIIAWVLVKSDVFSFVTKIQTDASLGVIVLLGVIASVSTCLAVTGGVIMGFTELIEDGKGWQTHAKLHGSFHIGRVLGFFVFGALLGGVGSFFSVGLGFAPYMNALIAIIFVYLGLQLLGIVPSLSSLGVHLPESWSRGVFNYKNPYLAPVVGALTFFLPCGFTQGVQLMALASGSRWMGGLMMAVFALGTIPGLLALGMGTSFAKDHRKQGFEKIVAGLLLVFGFFTLWGSMSIWGWTSGGILATGNDSSSVGSNEVVASDDSFVELTLGHNGYQLVPETSTIEKGNNYRITITPTKNGLGCMTTVKAPRIGSKIYNVVAGQPMTFEITNARGTYDFVCGAMGMKQGAIVAQ